MTTQDMIDLLICWDAYTRLLGVLGCDDTAFGEPGTVIGDLARIEDIISRNAVVPEDKIVDIMDSPGTPEERARKLLGQ